MERSDQDVRQRVLAALRADDRLSSQPIDVTVSREHVALVGSVQSFRRKTAAQEIAVAACGTALVENKLEVVPPENPSDKQIAEEVRSLIDEDARLVGQALVVEVRAGRVTLSGAVADAADRLLAEDVALQAPGAQSIVNQVVVDPGACNEAVILTAELELLLKHAPELSDAKLKLAISGDIAVLWGVARTRDQIDRATELVQSVWQGQLRAEVTFRDEPGPG